MKIITRSLNLSFLIKEPNKVKDLQQRIVSIKLPQSVHRRNFDLRHVANWKASEFKNFFFYIAIPCLDIFMDKLYIFNLYCLILGI